MPLTFPRPLLRRAAAALATCIGLLAATSAQAVIPASQRQYLIDFYNHTNGPTWTTRTNWLGDVGTECTWLGVTGDAGQTTVTRLTLRGNNLTDPVNAPLPDWAALPNLEMINLSENNLGGTLPPIAGLAALQVFEVGRNQLNGSLPSPAGLSQLQAYFVSQNQFTGGMPALTGLPALTHVRASSNQLTGPLPALSGLANLIEASFSNNQFTGSLPALAGLANLVEFHADNNQLSGSIPPLTGLGSLTSLQLERNQLTGSIPSLPSSLRRLSVRNNQLTGTLPAAPASLVVASSFVCPNPLTASADPAWDAATGQTPWYAPCAAAAATSVPTLQDWGLLLSALLMGLASALFLRPGRGLH